MENFKHTVLIGYERELGAIRGKTYVTIEYKDGKLSITGVVGPKSNGDAHGSCGQICIGTQPKDFLALFKIRKSDIVKLWEIWDEWHLNDMRAGCEHQRANWKDALNEDLTVYYWRLNQKLSKQKKELIENAVASLKLGATVRFTDEELATVNIPDAIHTETPEEPANYAPRSWEPIKTKKANWVYPSEHSKGLLCKRCEVCGYEYGSAWMKSEVPEDVLQWLYDLPTSGTDDWGRKRTY